MNEGQSGFARMPLQWATFVIGATCLVTFQHCPTNGDPSYDIRKLKPPTERLSAPPAKDPIPPELHCQYVKH
ncbi:E3 ubiquitin ligase PQT3-like isoform X2 [Iris pallida]|uniref:E3 ubiquitin ligase PQT3-like isoform X2 n=1 Tax=Iris pallida TaxID=29817 RepID=A0AAX6IJL9_IRIPA|nr:E3 ubiquitin ligase PQT3-like isoform X2 [Iris pallida]